MSRSRPAVVVLVAEDDPDPPGLEPLAAAGADVEVVRDGPSLERACADADILAVYDFRTALVHDLGERAATLAWIHAASAGVDAVLTPSVVAADTEVTNARGVFDDAIAEWVLAVLLLFAKDLRTTLEHQAARTWRHRESERLAGRHVLVIGAGSIGGAVGRLCGAAGMVVRGVARHRRVDDPDFELVLPTGELLDVLPWADDVVVAAPLTAETRGLLDAAAFDAMRPGTRVVNVGRGPVIDQAALVTALRAGQVGAAALDVFEEEPLPADDPLWGMGNVVVSPHMSGDAVGWVEALSAQFVANVERWRAGDPLAHTVDKRALAGVAR